MNIKVNTSVLESKAAYANRLALQLKEMVSQINRIHNRLDWEVKSRQAIDSSLHSLQQRMEKAEQKMYNISSFLSTTAGRYQVAEKTVVANGSRLADASSNGVNVGDVGAAKGKSEGKKWYQTNLFKLAVGAVVIGAAVAAAITVGGPILVGMAVGAAIGAAVGGVIGGVSSKISGGSFIDGFSDGFMWGAIGGAATGGLEAVGLGMAGIAVGNGLISSSIYVGQTLQNGGHVTIAGVATTFAVGAGLSVLGKVVSSKLSEVLSKGATEDVSEEVAKKVTNGAGNDEVKAYTNSRPSYGKEQVEQVWENAKDPVTGKVYDPTGKEITWDKSKPRSGQWDMGHIPGEKYSDMHELYMNGTISKEEFLEWYRNPENYRPELPSTNRSHKYE